MKKVHEPTKLIVDDTKVAHNYSSQYLNSTAMAMEKLREDFIVCITNSFVYKIRQYISYLLLKISLCRKQCRPYFFTLSAKSIKVKVNLQF